MTVELTKTSSHTTVVAELASTPVAGEQIFPTYLVTSANVEIGTAASPLYVSPGTGATWAVSAASLPLPTGAATSANQATEITHLATLAGAVSGTEVQVDVLTLPTVTIQDGGGSITVDGTVAVSGSVVVTNAGTFAVQAAQSGTWTVTGAGGTFPVTDSGGSLTVDDGGGSITVDGTVAVSGTVTVDSELTTADLDTGAGTDTRAVVGLVLAASGGGLLVGSANPMPISDNSGSITVDNAGTFAVQAAQSGTWTVTGSGGTFPVTDSGGSLTVDAPVATPVFVRLSDGSAAITTLPVSLASSVTVVGAAASGASKSGNPVQVGAVFNATQPTVTTGQAVELQATARGGLIVATGTDTFNVTVNAALPAGTNAIGKLAANSGVTIGAVEIAASQTLATVTTCSTVTTLTGSGVAHDGVDSGNPHKIGFKATTSLSGATMVAAGDRTDAMAGIDGAQIVRPHCNLEDIVSGVASITDGSSTSVIAAQGAGVKVYVTAIAIANSSATAVTVDIRDGAAGTVKMTLPVPASTSGVVLPLPVPLPFSANTAVCADPSAAASTVTVTLIGFKSKV